MTRAKGFARLLRFWVTFDEPVDRRSYLVHGTGLMLLKYSCDAALVFLGTGSVWMPWDYLHPVPLLLSGRLASASLWVAPALAIWTLPFVWIGVSMSIRRLLDAGRSAWWALFFFVPGVNYILMTILCLLPTATAPRFGAARVDPAGHRLPSALLSIALGAAFGLGMFWLSVIAMNSYGLALFMGTPFAIGLVTGYTLCSRYPASVRETYEVVTMTMLVVAGSAFVVGFEGIVCLLMVAPLGVLVAMMGASVGRFLARSREHPVPGMALILILLPGGAGLEAGQQPARLREVRSEVVVQAPPLEVWESVVAFSPIPAPTSLLFRLGVAYPVHAEIVGEGVGAVRYCLFSTGAFVEPITAWEPGARLAFDVEESPPPMRELSFADVAPPHLEGYLVATRGEFRLVELPDGSTRLEGSTWYEQRLRPEGYWVLFSDAIIRRVHRRVLDHIAAEAAAR